VDNSLSMKSLLDAMKPSPYARFYRRRPLNDAFRRCRRSAD
jgi:hypothetical protein